MEELYLVICGGGHISYPLCTLAKMLEYHVAVIDDREEFANRERFTQADEVYCMNFETALQTLSFPEQAFYVIVTRGHQNDYECLRAILKRNYAYIGMIGSKAKVKKTLERLREDGYTEEEIQKVHAPIGLAIGAETPEEIAVSIVAEMIQEKSKLHLDIMPKEIANVLKEQKEEIVLMTIISKKGSAPRGVGAKMVLTKSGNMAGTIGGGSIEYEACKRAAEMFAKEKERMTETFDLSTGEAGTLGMICGGSVEVLFEKMNCQH